MMREVRLTVALYALGAALMTEGFVLLGEAWLVVPVMAVAWGCLLRPLFAMTRALQDLYIVAWVRDEDGRSLSPEEVATAVEEATGFPSRVRRRTWAEDRFRRQQEAARGA
jgi:hypothetical protein